MRLSEEQITALEAKIEAISKGAVQWPGALQDGEFERLFAHYIQNTFRQPIGLIITKPSGLSMKTTDASNAKSLIRLLMLANGCREDLAKLIDIIPAERRDLQEELKYNQTASEVIYIMYIERLIDESLAAINNKTEHNTERRQYCKMVQPTYHQQYHKRLQDGDKPVEGCVWSNPEDWPQREDGKGPFRPVITGISQTPTPSGSTIQNPSGQGTKKDPINANSANPTPIKTQNISEHNNDSAKPTSQKQNIGIEVFAITGITTLCTCSLAGGGVATSVHFGLIETFSPKIAIPATVIGAVLGCMAGLGIASSL